MKAAIQNKIAPNTGKNVQKLNNLDVEDQTGVYKNRTNDVDFKSVLVESNATEAIKREARKNGDLSTADDYQSFLDELSKQTEQKDAPKNTMDKDDFLTLFVTQLQHQDPLNPKDGTEMASQLAQFNSLEQMMNVNSTLQNMVSAQENSEKLQFLNYVGKEVSVGGGKIALQDDEINDVTFLADRELGRSTMVVKDTTGQEVYRRELGVLGAGKHKLNWNGIGTDGKKHASGVYHVEVKAMTSSGDPVQVPLTSNVVIRGVDLVKNAENLYTDIGPLNFEDIQAVGSKGFHKSKDINDTAGVERISTKDQIEALEKIKQEALREKEKGGQTNEVGQKVKGGAAVQAAVDEAAKADAKAAVKEAAKSVEGATAGATAGAPAGAPVSESEMTPEMMQQAQKLAADMGYSLAPNAQQGPTKSGRIPITAGQHAQTSAAPKS